MPGVTMGVASIMNFEIDGYLPRRIAKGRATSRSWTIHHAANGIIYIPYWGIYLLQYS
jgi:hypothetical protein